MKKYIESIRDDFRKNLDSTRYFILLLYREKFLQLSIMALLLVILCGLIFFNLEYRGLSQDINWKQLFDSFWWAVVTMTTVGYGNIVPETFWGKLVSIVLMVGGFLLLSLITAVIASVMVERKIREGKGLEEIKTEKHLVICGWNNFGEEIFYGLDKEPESFSEIVLVNDLDESQFNEIKYKFQSKINVCYIKGDFTNESVLKRANISDAKVAVILADTSGGNKLENADERTILATLAVKTLSPKIKVCAEAVKKESQSHLKRAMADDVVVRGEYTGYMIANSAIAPGIPLMLKELLNLNLGKNFSIVSVPSQYIGKTFGELFKYFRKHSKDLLVGIVSEEPEVSIGDILSHDMSAIDKFIARKIEQAPENVCQLIRKSAGLSVKVNPEDDYIIKENEKGILITHKEA